MTKIAIAAGDLLEIVDAMDDVFPPGVKLPIGLSVRVGELRLAVSKYHAELMARVTPLIEKHTDGGNTISPGDKGHPAFVVEAAPHFAERVEVPIEPIPLAELEAVEGLKADPDIVVVLVTFGLITKGATL